MEQKTKDGASNNISERICF